jgi:drug/metabolite transporter (DMT)-like permease
MLIQIGPLLIALLAAMFLGQRLTPYVLVGIAIAFCGVAIISLANGEGGSGDVWGVVLTVLAAVTYAIGVVSQKPLTARVPPFELILLSCLIGVVTSLPFAGGLADLADAPVSTWLWIIYLGVFPTAIAFSTWAYALKRMGAARLSITTFLVPVIAIALAWIILSEAPQPLAYLGGALCVVGVLISRRQPRRVPREAVVRDEMAPDTP